jgi:uncharacterized protein YcgI (DUF1989 family)
MGLGGESYADCFSVFGALIAPPDCLPHLPRFCFTCGLSLSLLPLFLPSNRNAVIDPFNIFQNTPYYSLKALGSSKAGDYAEFKNVLGVDLVVGLSCCPFEGDSFNGGRVTSVGVVVEV